MSAATKRADAAVRQTLQWLRMRGFKPVLLHPRSKAAVSKGYEQAGYAPPDDDAFADQGVGVATGPMHAGPIDADLDCPEAAFFWPRFAPETPAVFGRESKPASHHLYRVEEESFVRTTWLDPIPHPGPDGKLKRDMLLELRGDKLQTVCPGSLHQDTGELVEFQGHWCPEVPVVEIDKLSDAARMTAIACLIARHMWHEGQRNEVAKHLPGALFYLDWKVERAEALVRAVMDYCGDDDKTRLPTLRATFRKGEQGKRVTGATSLRKLLGPLAPAVDKLVNWAGSEAAGVVEEYNSHSAVVNLGGKMRVADTRQVPFSFSTQDDFVKLRAPDTITDDEGKRVPKARLWLASRRRRQYDGVAFLPGLSEDDCPEDVLNLWTGWAVAPSAEGSCEAWLELLRTVVCADEQEARWLDNWFAGVVRDPMNKPGTAPVIVGKFGAGKTLLLDFFSRLLGPHYTVATQEDHVHGKFNKHLSETLLLHSEEALTARDRKHRGIVKSLITDRFAMREIKGVDAVQIRSFLRLVLTSNELDAAPVEPGDRRFTILDLGERVISPELVERVVAERDGGGPARLLHRYQNEFDYDPQLVRANVRNEARAAMMGHSYDAVEAWWFEALQTGQLLPDSLAWAQRPDAGLLWPKFVALKALHCALVLSTKERPRREPLPDSQRLRATLERFVGRGLFVSNSVSFDNPNAAELTCPPEVRALSERMRPVTDLPTLAECRAAWDAYSGSAHPWPEETPDERPAPPEKVRRY